MAAKNQEKCTRTITAFIVLRACSDPHSPWTTQSEPHLEATALSFIFPPMQLPRAEIPIMTSFHFLSQPHPKTPFSASREASW